MEYENIKGITREWQDMTNNVINLKEIPIANIENLIVNTYEILDKYHQETLIPKAITELLLGTESFLSLSSAIEHSEDRKGLYHSLDVNIIMNAIKIGFLNDKYECTFPKIKIYDFDKNPYIIDLSKSFLPLALDDTYKK